jgi:ankyrin repeat protein
MSPAQLHAAVESGNVDAAREFLTQHPDLVDQGRGEVRPLHMAIFRRDLPMTKLLLECGADTDTGIWPNRDATAPYVIARERGYEEILQAIHEGREKQGARGPKGPNDVTRKLREAYMTGREEAMVAVYEEHPELAQMCPPNGLTMLHQMAGHGSLLMLKWLLDHGAEVNRKCKRTDRLAEWTALDFAASGEGSEKQFDPVQFHKVATLLLEHGAELSPISAAALGRWDFLEKCLNKDIAGKQALEAAVNANQPDVLRRLLDRGLDPDERMPVGHPAENNWTAGRPLYQAVVLKRIELARILLERGADPNASVFAAGSAAYRAYEAGDTDFIALVNQYGAKLDPGSTGYARQVEMARKMLAGEIDPPIEPNDFSGRTIAEQLLWGGASSSCAEIVRMALEKVDLTPGDPHWIGWLWRPLPCDTTESVECFQMILARCGPHHLWEPYEQTILHEVACRQGNLDVAKMLLDAGAPLDVRDKFLKSTPLGWACRWGHIGLVKLLLARGADPIEANAEPWATPRAWAEKMKRPQILELLK